MRGEGARIKEIHLFMATYVCLIIFVQDCSFWMTSVAVLGGVEVMKLPIVLEVAEYLLCKCAFCEKKLYIKGEILLTQSHQ